MSKEPHHAPAPKPVADAAKNQHALASLRPTLLALPSNELLIARINTEEAARRVLQIALGYQTPAFLKLIEPIPHTMFDATHITRAEQAARATLELIALRRSEDVQASSTRLEPALVAKLKPLKLRMKNVLEHYFSDHAEYGPELVDIASGTGYEDDASDLVRYAALYARPDVHAMISRDPKFWNPHDETEARKVSEQIYRELDAQQPDGERTSADLMRRAWTVLDVSYDQVRRIGTFVYWSDAEKLAGIPPLASLGRKSRVHKPGTASTPGGATGDAPAEATPDAAKR